MQPSTGSFWGATRWDRSGVYCGGPSWSRKVDIDIEFGVGRSQGCRVSFGTLLVLEAASCVAFQNRHHSLYGLVVPRYPAEGLRKETNNTIEGYVVIVP